MFLEFDALRMRACMVCDREESCVCTCTVLQLGCGLLQSAAVCCSVVVCVVVCFCRQGACTHVLVYYRVAKTHRIP